MSLNISELKWNFTKFLLGNPYFPEIILGCATDNSGYSNQELFFLNDNISC